MTLVVGINGSPRRNGNSARLLEQALSAAGEAGATVVRYDLAFMDISPCKACEACFAGGECIVHDGMDALYRSLEEADAVVIASPIYFSGMSTYAKIAVDRCQALWVRRRLLDRARKPGAGAIILTAGQPDAKFDNAISELRAFLVGTGFTPGEVLKVAGADRPSFSADRPEMLVRARELGRNLLSSISGP